MTDDELARLVDRALRELPAPRAPHALTARVMQAVAANAPGRPAPPRTWFTWPLAWQLLSAIAVVVVLGGAMRAWPVASDRVQAVMAAPLDAVGAPFATVSERVGAWMTVGRIVWRGFVEPVAPVALVLILVMCVMSVTLGAAFRHVALGGTSS